MKMIKFDLPIDGVKVKTAEELCEHFTIEILDHYRSGLLEKWLLSRKMHDELTAVKAIDGLDEFALLKALSGVFGVEIDDQIAAVMLHEAPLKKGKTIIKQVDSSASTDTKIVNTDDSDEKENISGPSGFYNRPEDTVETEKASASPTWVSGFYNRPEDTVEPQRSMGGRIKTLGEIMEAVAYKFNDSEYDNGVYFGDKLNSIKATRKINNSEKSFVRKRPSENLIVFIDLTVMGSGEDGLYMTEKEIYLKAAHRSRSIIKIMDIKSISHDRSGGRININYRPPADRYIWSIPYCYEQNTFAKYVDVIVDAINEYISQFP